MEDITITNIIRNDTCILFHKNERCVFFLFEPLCICRMLTNYKKIYMHFNPQVPKPANTEL